MLNGIAIKFVKTFMLFGKINGTLFNNNFEGA